VPQSSGGIAAGAITNTMLAGGITPGKLSTGGPVWDASGNLTATSFVGPVTGAVTGNASTATRLATARTISLSGDVTGTASFDGSANATIAATVPNNSVTAAKLGSTERLQLCKAFVNFNGADAIGTTTNRVSGETIVVTSGSSAGVWNISSTTSTVVGQIYTIPSIGGVANATLGGVVVATGGFQITGINSGTQYAIRLLNGAATSNQTITGNGTASGFQVIILGIRSSYNVSSITKLGAGDYQISFQTLMADAGYTVVAQKGASNSVDAAFANINTNGQTTTGVRVSTGYGTGALTLSDYPQTSVLVFGN
jgi:hypothetical protein